MVVTSALDMDPAAADVHPSSLVPPMQDGEIELGREAGAAFSKTGEEEEPKTSKVAEGQETEELATWRASKATDKKVRELETAGMLSSMLQ